MQKMCGEVKNGNINFVANLFYFRTSFSSKEAPCVVFCQTAENRQ